MRPPLSQIAAFLKPKRRWFQYRVRTILILMTVFAIWLSINVKHVREQKRAVHAILKVGGQVTYLHERESKPHAPGPAWLRRILSDDWFQRVDIVTFHGAYSLTDADAECLSGLKSVRRLDFSDTQIGDRTLAIAGKMPRLRHIYLMNTKVTEAGLEHLRGLDNLSMLDLQATPVSSLPTWMDEREGLRVFFP